MKRLGDIAGHDAGTADWKNSARMSTLPATDTALVADLRQLIDGARQVFAASEPKVRTDEPPQRIGGKD